MAPTHSNAEIPQLQRCQAGGTRSSSRAAPNAQYRAPVVSFGGMSGITRPWSNNRLRAVGKALRDGTATPEDVQTYNEVMEWFNDLAVGVQQTLNEHDWGWLSSEDRPNITSRAKTRDTLTQKLQRDPNTPLYNVQDIAGVRFETQMILDEQDRVASEIATMFGHDADCIHDLRSAPHSGYRGLHVWLRTDKGRVEVQVRTYLQGVWANAYESAADVLGRQIRYGQPPLPPLIPAGEPVVAELHRLSKLIADLETMRNGPVQMATTAEASARSMIETARTTGQSLDTTGFDEAVRRKDEVMAQFADVERTVADRLESYRAQFDEMKARMRTNAGLPDRVQP